MHIKSVSDTKHIRMLVRVYKNGLALLRRIFSLTRLICILQATDGAFLACKRHIKGVHETEQL